MRNFIKIAENVETNQLLLALAARPELWNQHDIRTTYPDSPHAQADDILLMFNDTDGEVVNDIQTHPFDAWFQLPVQEMVLNLMRHVRGVQLGRVLITRLAPGKSITPHADQGAPADFYQRYQIALQSLPGCTFRSGEEVIQFASGEVWWFDNTKEHEVVNNSADDRIVMIVDIRVC